MGMDGVDQHLARSYDLEYISSDMMSWHATDRIIDQADRSGNYLTAVKIMFFALPRNPIL